MSNQNLDAKVNLLFLEVILLKSDEKSLYKQ